MCEISTSALRGCAGVLQVFWVVRLDGRSHLANESGYRSGPGYEQTEAGVPPTVLH